MNSGLDAATQRRDYRPIADYAIIGDAHTAALVARDGSIDWCCLPHFDSPAVLCRLLDARKGGWFRVGPNGPFETTRAYVGATNVLTTTFTANDGKVRLTDCMPVEPRSGGRGEDIAPTHEIVRLIEGLAGEVEIEVSFRPTFDFARACTERLSVSAGAVATAGAERVTLTCPWPLRPDASGTLRGYARVRPGDRLWLVMSYTDGDRVAGSVADGFDPDDALERTLRYWESWAQRCTYEGTHGDLVRRSALTLKLLTFEPSGAIIAAPTTSLPEEIGGVRNWDYRFTWLRDAALTLDALMSLGYYDEAMDFWEWLQRLHVTKDGPLQAMYRINGSPDLPERELPHLDGYAGSRPVRIGNGAAAQRQIDVYGEVLAAAHTCVTGMPTVPHRRFGGELSFFANRAASEWREPDQGIWEMRTAPRHFLHSKLLCWVALDRALRLADLGVIEGPRDMWAQARSDIASAIVARGFDTTIGAFTQAFDEPALDASALLVPLVGFVPASDSRVQATVRRIQERLVSNGLVYRYLGNDGLPGTEATFALCTFWLVDALALSGRLDEAVDAFERVVAFANDVGLLSEELDPTSGRLLGNYPQGFTHLALIRSALHIAKAESPDA